MPVRSHALALALCVAFAALFASGCAGEATSADISSAPCDDIAPLDVADAADTGGRHLRRERHPRL